MGTGTDGSGEAVQGARAGGAEEVASNRRVIWLTGWIPAQVTEPREEQQERTDTCCGP